jgi:threonine dehydrogenase-like Zn-dependent dehydrogenase
VSKAEVTNVFIYGASTTAALYAAQMVRLSAKAGGRTVRLFGTASRARWDLLTAEPYGYDFFVDYRDEHWPERVKELTGGAGIHYAFNCISEGDPVARTSSALESDGKMVIVGAVWEGLREEVQFQGGFTVRRSPAARGCAVAFYAWLSGNIGSDLIPNPIRLIPGGLEKVVEDVFQLLGAGGTGKRQVKRMEEWMRTVSAEKFVYKIQEI